MCFDFATGLLHAADAHPPISADQDTSRREDLIEICKEVMALRERGDFARLAAYLTDDCELTVPGQPGMNPLAGSARGREECLIALRANFTLIEAIGLVPMTFIQEADSIVVSWSASMRNRGTGPTIEVKGLMHLTFRGNQIAVYANYLDTAAIANLAGMPVKSI